MRIFDCRDDAERDEGLKLAAAAIGRGELVVLPTDTVYGVAADAFDPAAVARLLAAKGRGRQMPPPVLISGPDVLPALATHVSDDVAALTDRFWPGGLTVIVWAQASLHWDLGETGGTVALRVPDHPVALELLRSTGPLAVSSANLSGRPPATTAARAQSQLSGVEVYLEAGPVGGHPSQETPVLASSIVDATGELPLLVRAGAVSLADLREVVPDMLDGVGAADWETPRPVTPDSVSTSTQEADGGG